MNTLVIDTSVFNKLFLDEADSDDVVTLFDKARDAPLRLLAPDLLYLEVINTANTYRLPIQQIIELIEFQTRHLLTLKITDCSRAEKSSRYYPDRPPQKRLSIHLCCRFSCHDYL